MATKNTPVVPDGYNTVNPFVITKDARQLVEFIKEVFDGVEQPDALTYDTDKLVIHSEVKVGNSIISILDRKKDWPFTPSLLQVYVSDVDATLKRATQHGATIITKPTDSYGVKFSRLRDKWHNLWWVYQYTGEVSWDDSAAEQGDGAWQPTKEANYIHDTLLDAMRNLDK
jgi:PhnB protein